VLAVLREVYVLFAAIVGASAKRRWGADQSIGDPCRRFLLQVGSGIEPHGGASSEQLGTRLGVALHTRGIIAPPR